MPGAMTSACSCRSVALRTFVRSVAQVQLPNDAFAKSAPWHEARRQLHQARAPSWPNAAALPYRSVRTATTDSATASELDHEPAEEAGTGAATSSDQAASSSMLSGNKLLAQEAAAAAPMLEEKPKPFASPNTPGLESPRKRGRPRKAPASKAPAQTTVAVDAVKAKPASSSTDKIRRVESKQPVFEPLAEDPWVETFSVADVEAKREAQEKERELRRERLRAERKQRKLEEEQHREIARQRREKEYQQNRPAWALQKEALKKKFPEGWKPRRKLSPDALNGIRALNNQFPDTYTTVVLANKFEVSPEAIRRILKSRWEPTPEVEEDRQRRWHNRGVGIWEMYQALGRKAPAKWRRAPDEDAGVRREGQEKEQRNRKPRAWDDEEMEGDDIDPEKYKRITMQQRISKRLI